MGIVNRVIVLLELYSVLVFSQPDIIYKRLDTFNLIWADYESGAAKHVAIWEPVNNEYGFYILGHVATSSYSKPSGSLVVKSNGNNALAAPVSTTYLWKDSGSGAKWDVTFYKLIPPNGYTCLGDIAVRSWVTKPDLNKYRCVKNEYLVMGQLDNEIWDDGGSGAHTDVVIYEVRRSSSEYYGLEARNFRARNYTGNLYGVRLLFNTMPMIFDPMLIKDDGNKVKPVWSLSAIEGKPLHLYEVRELQRRWDDRGSGGWYDVSIWSVEHYGELYSLGDIAVNSYSKPATGYLVKAMKADALSPPHSFREVYNDGGTGSTMDVTIWKPNCQAGYVSLGHVATSGEDPSYDSIRCVNHNYTNQGKWKWIWNDARTGGNMDCTIYEAESDDDQDVHAMSAIGSYYHKPRGPIVLKRSEINYFSEKPIIKLEIREVKYDIPEARTISSPATVAKTKVINYSNLQQSVSRSLSFEKSSTSSWTFGSSIEIGISAEISAGVPLIGAKITMSVSTTFSYETGKEESKSEQDAIEAVLTVPARSMMVAFVKGTQYESDIPFEATVEKTYFDGTKGKGKMRGVFKGVVVSEFEAQYGDTVDIPSDATCGDNDVICLIDVSHSTLVPLR